MVGSIRGGVSVFVGVLLTAILCACGGGGDSSSSSTSSSTDSAVALRASVYAGNFVGHCFPLANASNYETGAAVFLKTALSVGASDSASAPVVLRLDFFDDVSCGGQPIGTLANTNSSNALTLISATSIDSRPAHRVTLRFGNASAIYQSGPSADTVIYGTALRLKLPRMLFTGFLSRDLWSLDKNDLYEGNYTYDADGFPTGLLERPMDTKVATLPSVPEAPCAAETVNWRASGNSCVGSTTPSASQRSQQLISTPATGTVGGATFTCSDGNWSAPSNATCNWDSPVFPTCPVQTITWSSGSNTCSGETPVTIAGVGNVVSVANTIPGNSGSNLMSCQADGSWAVWANTVGGCWVTPPPITDPLQLAQSKNCLACHSVSNPGYSSFFGPTGYTFPSFQTIANYYRASPPVAGVLENKIKFGSIDVFGPVPMGSNSQVSDDDLAILVPWILSQPNQ